MNKEILRLAIPNILSNISIPLLSSVDTALMGQLSAAHIGAVGIGSMIFNFLYWNFGFLRMGTTGITAQAYGEQTQEQILLTLGRASVLAVLIAFCILLLQFPFAHLSTWLMNISEIQLPLVEEYFYIRIWAAPATLLLYALLGWFFGMQNAIYPLIITISINVINIVASLFLIKYMGYEIKGVAYGTVIAQYVGLALGIVLLSYKYRYLFAYFTKNALLQWEALRGFLRINRDIFIRTFCLTFAFGFFYSRSALGGEELLAVNVILLQFLSWMSYGIDGFAFATESLVGKYVGAKNQFSLNKAIRLSFIWAMGLAVFYSMLYGIFGVSLIGLFTKEVPLVLATQPYLFWMILFPLLSTPCYIWDGIFIGLTASAAMRDTMLLALLLYLLCYFVFQSWLNNHGLWLSFLLFMVARGGMQWWIFYRRRLGEVSI